METLTVHTKPKTPGHPVGPRVYSGLDTGSWRAAAPASFQPRAANDDVRTSPSKGAYVPPWVLILGGALLAAIIGALLGGALHV